MEMNTNILKKPTFIWESMRSITSEINERLEQFFIEGLKRKGFEFDNRNELVEFIKSNCRCEDKLDLKERMYFVNGIPFLLHHYETKTEYPITENMCTKINVSFGYIDFI